MLVVNKVIDREEDGGVLMYTIVVTDENGNQNSTDVGNNRSKTWHNNLALNLFSDLCRGFGHQ